MDLDNPVSAVENDDKMHLSRNDIIYQEGDSGEEMYLIVQGAVQLRRQVEGSSIIVAELGAGGFFGELSLLDGEQRGETAVAVEDTELTVLQQESLRELIKSDFDLTWRMLKGISANQRKQNKAFVTQVSKDLQEVSGRLKTSTDGIATAIEQISASTEEVETNDKRLADRIKEIKAISKRISESLEFIGNVAKQTKVFGLNASIEAARSGEFGKGFGIIAEEIRKLSEVSRQNADIMSELTLQINEKMEQVTQATIHSTQKSKEQSSASKAMAQSLEEVAATAAKLTGLANGLSGLS